MLGAFRLSAVVAASVACAVATGVAAAPYQDTHPCKAQCEVQKFIDQNVGIAIDRPVTLAELRKFARVLSENTTKAGAAGLSDTIHEFRYTGLVVRVEVTAENTVLVQTIELTGGAFRLPFNIKLGKIDARHDIDTVLGAPAETRRAAANKPMHWIYHNPEGTQILTFVRTDDTLLAVQWDFTGGD